MFGNFNLVQDNKKVDRVEFREDENSRYQAANNKKRIIIDTPLGRVYVNNDSYFANVPRNVWTSNFKDEVSPEELLKIKIGENVTDDIIKELQGLLSDLIDAEYNSKNEES